MITTFGWGGPPVLVLDEHPGACGAYSLRRLSGLYNGAAVRVRRSSDNAEQDIYFTDTFGFDVSAFNSFVGAGTGYVKTWYDQSSNGKDLTQATTTKQPQINGTEIIFDGATSWLRCSTWSGFTYTGDGNVYLVANSADNNPTAGNVIGTCFSQTDSSGNNEMLWSLTRSSLTGIYGSTFGNITGWFYGNTTKALNTYYLVNFVWENYGTYFTNGRTKIMFNNVENIPYHTTSSTNPSALGNGRLDIGKQASNFSQYFLNGKMKELIFFNLNNNNALNDNINSTYSLY